ncbi:hypothetical protein SAMN06297251_12553 [Fulvimarina manganoxydans]|uniref:Uncharacterized protein n=1 Tax=Fulvimarina manganoxydans TaxID=937218 RepID=A0A1W2EH50_9HYPH|nr:hypothetical protein SAMN06297251_12553 [Fulvimarina manganoxydans]
MGNSGATSLSAFGAPSQPCHLGVQAVREPRVSLTIDEDELSRVKIGLFFEPGLTRGKDVFALLLGSVRGLFST